MAFEGCLIRADNKILFYYICVFIQRITHMMGFLDKIYSMIPYDTLICLLFFSPLSSVFTSLSSLKSPPVPISLIRSHVPRDSLLYYFPQTPLLQELPLFILPTSSVIPPRGFSVQRPLYCVTYTTFSLKRNQMTLLRQHLM